MTENLLAEVLEETQTLIGTVDHVRDKRRRGKWVFSLDMARPGEPETDDQYCSIEGTDEHLAGLHALIINGISILATGKIRFMGKLKVLDVDKVQMLKTVHDVDFKMTTRTEPQLAQ